MSCLVFKDVEPTPVTNVVLHNRIASVLPLGSCGNKEGPFSASCGGSCCSICMAGSIISELFFLS